MEKSKTVHVVELNARAQNLQNALKNLQKDFAGMAVPKDLDKIFSRLSLSLDAIVKKTSKGIIPREDFQDAEKEVNKVKTAFDSLSTVLDGIRNSNDKKLLSLIPDDTTQKINAASLAYAAYAKELASVVSAERALETALTKKAEAQKNADTAENSARAYKGKVTQADNELKKHQAITDALREQKEATEELNKAQKAYDTAVKAGNTKSAENKLAKLNLAKDRKSSADNTVSGFTKKQLEDQAAAVEKKAKAEEKYAIAKKNSENAQKSLTSAEVTAQSAATNLQNAKKKNQEDIQRENAALSKLKEALTAVNPKYKDMAVEGKTASEKLESLKVIIESLAQDELKKLKESLGDAGENFGELQGVLETLKKTLNDTKEETKAQDKVLADQSAFESRIKQFLGLSGAANVLRRALRDALSTITELDATMTEMAVVTDLTVGDYWDQLPEYSQRASELGVSINSAYKAATLYYQQGLKTNEVNAISAETLKLAKIAGIDAAEATDKMTAALRGFNMELNETSAQRVADVYAKLAAITAADVDEISTAMTKTASIASSAGMEFETTAAFLSQIVETTRESAETAGTAMKTVIARFQELKKSPDEIGEVEGEIVDANAIEGALRSVGVSLRDTQGQFRELDDVFLELSSKWDGLDKNTQRYIATIAAGSRQQSRFIAMMQDYARTQELVTAANNSAGASQKQFEKTMESLEAKIEKLKNAWHEFTMGIMDSDLVKFGVDVLTKFLEIINKATSALDGIGGSITKISTIIGVFKLGQKVFDKFRAPMVRLFADVVAEASKTGTEAAEAMYDSANKKFKEKESKTEEQKARTKGQQFGDATIGLSSWQSGISGLREAGKQKKELKRLKGNVKAAKTLKKTGEKGADDALKKAEEDLKNYGKTEEDITKKSQQSWDDIGKGISQVGQSVSNLGIGVSMLGGLISQLGFEELGAGIAGVGNAITMVGAALSIIPPILTLITSHPIVALITIIVGALLFSIIAIVKHLNSISPEGKLKAAKETAEEAGKAAAEAAESFDNLNSAIDSLSEKEGALDGMIKGSKEWKEQVSSINSEVLDLIKQYPKLAKIVKTTNGVLSLDKNKKEEGSNISIYDQVIAEAEALKLGTAISSQLADLDVARKQNDVFRSKLVKDVSFAYEGTRYLGTVLGENGYRRQYEDISTGERFESNERKLTNAKSLNSEQIDILAKALASGKITPELLPNNEILYKLFGEIDTKEARAAAEKSFAALVNSIGDGVNALEQYGQTLLTFESQEMTMYDSLASAIVGTVDTMSKADERINQLFNIVDGEDYKEKKESIEKAFQEKFGEEFDVSDKGKLKNIDTFKNNLEGIAAANGLNMTADDIVKNAIYEKYGYENARITSDGKLQYMEGIDWKDADWSTVQGAFTEYLTKEAIKTETTNVDNFIEGFNKNANISDEYKEVFNKALEDDTGANLTYSEYETLGGLLYDSNVDMDENVRKELEKAYKSAYKAFGSPGLIDDLKDNATAGQALGVSKLFNMLPEEQREGLLTQFTNLDDDTRGRLYASLAGMSNDPTALTQWQNILPSFISSGGIVSEGLTTFLENMSAAFNATYSDSWLRQMGVGEAKISEYQTAVENGGDLLGHGGAVAGNGAARDGDAAGLVDARDGLG